MNQVIRTIIDYLLFSAKQHTVQQPRGTTINEPVNYTSIVPRRASSRSPRKKSKYAPQTFAIKRSLRGRYYRRCDSRESVRREGDYIVEVTSEEYYDVERKDLLQWHTKIICETHLKSHYNDISARRCILSFEYGEVGGTPVGVYNFPYSATGGLDSDRIFSTKKRFTPISSETKYVDRQWRIYILWWCWAIENLYWHICLQKDTLSEPLYKEEDVVLDFIYELLPTGAPYNQQSLNKILKYLQPFHTWPTIPQRGSEAILKTSEFDIDKIQAFLLFLVQENFVQTPDVDSFVCSCTTGGRHIESTIHLLYRYTTRIYWLALCTSPFLVPRHREQKTFSISSKYEEDSHSDIPWRYHFCQAGIVIVGVFRHLRSAAACIYSIPKRVHRYQRASAVFDRSKLEPSQLYIYMVDRYGSGPEEPLYPKNYKAQPEAEWDWSTTTSLKNLTNLTL